MRARQRQVSSTSRHRSEVGDAFLLDVYFFRVRHLGTLHFFGPKWALRAPVNLSTNQPQPRAWQRLVASHRLNASFITTRSHLSTFSPQAPQQTPRADPPGIPTHPNLSLIAEPGPFKLPPTNRPLGTRLLDWNRDCFRQLVRGLGGEAEDRGRRA